jgi:hypothetical protein
MKANPGGQIDLKSVIGRDKVIADMWDTLEQQSIVMTAERRIGKTTIIKKMNAEPKAKWIPVLQDLEKCHTAADFAMAVYKDVHQFLSGRAKFTRRAKEWFVAFGGTEIGGVFTLPPGKEKSWKEVLTKSIEDLVHENDAKGDRLLFLWDEVPFMLANIRDREGEPVAMEVLDTLRELRQTHTALRMVITGSIGLHHVIKSLKEKNYGNAPINDMFPVEVEPLEQADAQKLASTLIDGERLHSSDKAAAAVAIAHEADCFPFYIHHVIKALRLKGLAADPPTVAKIVEDQLIDANDPWELLHYRERIPLYYGNDASAVCAILDDLAASRDKATINELLAMLKASSTFDDKERLLSLLTLMERDHYLRRHSDGYRFRFPLIRRWWKINRGL